MIGALWTKSDAEAAVVGAILIDADKVMPEAAEMLSAEDFLVPEYRRLFETCEGYFIDGKPIDPVTLSEQLGVEYRKIMVGAMDMMPTLSNWKHYAKLVKDQARRGRAYEKLSELSEFLVSGADVTDCQSLAVQVSEALNDTFRDTTVTPSKGLARFILNAQKPRSYYQTGFAKLDSYTCISPGDYIVVGGRPSTGKTALTLQIFLQMARQYKVAYFSLETSEEKIFDRLAAHFFQIPLWAIKAGNLKQWGNMPEKMKEFENLSFHVVEAAGWTVAQIQAKAVQLGAEIIFIDYLGLVKAEGSGRYEKITNISVDLHTMAQSRKITVVALSQLNREGKGEPTLENLRESGQIEQDADIVMLLHNLGEYENFDRELRIAKNKEGITGPIRLSFDGKHQTFRVIEDL